MNATAPAPAGGKHWLLREKRQPLPPFPHPHHPLRKRIHLAFFLVFLALPFSNLMRFDLPRQRFFFAGTELAISEFSIIFFALMFLMFLLAAAAIVFGRVYCGYACPQMIFSEWSLALEAWAGRRVQAWLPGWPKGRKALASRLLFYALLLLASVFLAFAFTSYFVPPGDLFFRLARFDLATVGGITGAVTTVLVFLDLALLRLGFCTTICPYGFLQGLIQDKQTLLVEYQDPGGACIDCSRCVRDCPMGIDIRKGPFQIECVHCGDCIDACEGVLRRVGHEGVIRYSWGAASAGGPAPRREGLLRRIGLRDAKRFVIMGVLVCYLSALGLAMALRKLVQIRIIPDRTTLFRVLPDGSVANQVRLDLANRSPRPVTVQLWVEGAPARFLGLPDPIRLAPGETLEHTYDLAAPAAWPGAKELNPVRVMAQSSDQAVPERAEMNFIMPDKGN